MSLYGKHKTSLAVQLPQRVFADVILTPVGLTPITLEKCSTLGGSKIFA